MTWLAVKLAAGRILKSIPGFVYVIALMVLILAGCAVTFTYNLNELQKDLDKKAEELSEIQQERDNLKGQVYDLSKLNENNRKAYKESLAQWEAAVTIARMEQTAAQERADFYRRVKDEVSRVQPGSDGCSLDGYQLIIDWLWDDKPEA